MYRRNRRESAEANAALGTGAPLAEIPESVPGDWGNGKIKICSQKKLAFPGAVVYTKVKVLSPAALRV